MLPKFFFISILFSLIFTHSHTLCLEHQKILLLQLKNELIFDSFISTKLVQWNQTDCCCNWYGVECDGAGYVIGLQLDGDTLSGGVGDLSSLFRLKYLEKLNVANNKFNSTLIPRGIRNLTRLTHLNLSYAGFGGQVPAEISSLKRLVSLDISNDHWVKERLKLEKPNLEMLLQNLTGLIELYLDCVDMSFDENKKWSHIIPSYLTHLTSLSFAYCGVSGPLAKSFWQLRSLSFLRLDGNDLSTTVPHLFAKFSSLTTLSLVGCGLNGSFPNMIFHMPSLQNLDLSRNELLSGSIPPFTQSGSLKSIVLSFTNFSGSIPNSISNLTTLSKIVLSSCKFTGRIPSTFGNLTELIDVSFRDNFFTGSLSSMLFEGLPNLVYLDLGANSFSGNIPHSLFRLPSLLELQLQLNQLTGLVEEFPVVNVSNIVTLDLSDNRLEGPIPDSFFQLHSLKYVFLSGNLFNGIFQLDKIRSLANLTLLDLSHNNLWVNVDNDNSSSTYGLPHLKELHLPSCNLYDFPDFIKHSDMRVLDLSNNRIGGEIPSWIWGTQLQHLDLSSNLLTDLEIPYHIPASLQILDLHSNQLRGELHLLVPPSNTSYVQYLLLANNSFSGSIPTSLCSATYLDVLDLSINRLSGSIPSCLSESITLSVINLGRNNISGRILDNLSPNCKIQHFDLNNNTLEGKIPKSLKNCDALELMNVRNNFINDTFPCMLSLSLRVLILQSNRFHGEMRCHQSWPDLQILDISSNNFSGSLESINWSSWRAMVLDNDAELKHNHLGSNFLRVSGYYTVGVTLTMKGRKVELVKIWPDFTAVDLSCNNFGGEMPNEIGDLTSLHLLNLSYNAFKGSIPESFGRLRELESLDLSENQLSGTIPVDLAGLTFLSVLNLSNNKLVGEIPNGRQLQTFSADSFKGNQGLCGFNLNISCSSHTDDGNDLSPPDHENEEAKREIEWEYVSAALGYVVGLGGFVWILIFCQSFKEKYFAKVDDVIEELLDGRNRRRKHARRVVGNRVRRQ